MSTFKFSSLLHIRIYRDCSKVILCYLYIRNNLNIPEAKYCFMWFISIPSFFTDIVYSLFNTMIWRLEVFSGKITILIQTFTVADCDTLSFMCIETEFYITGYILTKVNDRFFFRSFDPFTCESFSLYYIKAV